MRKHRINVYLNGETEILQNLLLKFIMKSKWIVTFFFLKKRNLNKVHMSVVYWIEQMEENEIRTPSKLFDSSLCEVMKLWIRMLIMTIK